MDIAIRPERPADRARIHEVTRAAFAGLEHSDGSEPDLVDRLRAGGAFVPQLSLVAEVDGEIVGHAMFTRASVRDDGAEHEILVLGPISVAPDFQRRGIGAELIEVGHDAAKELGFPGVALVGHPTYYPRFGYAPAERFGIGTHLDLPPGVFMVHELTPGALAGARGMLVYPPEFGLAP